MSDANTETISLLDLIELSNNARLGRAIDAAEKQVELLSRMADAAERQADALETITALFASLIGRAPTSCGAFAGEPKDVNVNFLRTGKGDVFHCDEQD
ncbi:hypothetical protein [Bradyrhizobium sp. STM 3809]|uniref:hypothetical protein n=1 Tax=Bradyrhizobium sp. STM 3809 TaxID=551936 RepID=UPI0002408E68|nr:hypothetical protein [Bradyrhizobium sp. STM 3809]CCE01132.1 hypothetical protein BRAS3809_4270006 [Bradyrhizobium sp. STM 3809]